MSEWYFASLLVMMGGCLAFALHAGTLAAQTRERRYVHLLALAILEGGYCFVTYRYFRETTSARALPWGQGICAFTPYITFVFGELTIDLTERKPRWLRAAQHVNLVVTTLFVVAVLSDMILGTELALRHDVETDLASAHRHLLSFTTLGKAYLGWVSIAFSVFAALLFRDRHARTTLAPMVVGCVVYFGATTLDFGILVRVRDGHFLQHFGFFALLVGCFRVLAGRFEQALEEQKAAIARLEEQRQKLLLAAPMLHKQKLDSLGTLAAGVAHEINNPISGILNYAQLMKRRIPPDSEDAVFVDEIEHEAQRVANIVKDLLHFGRAGEANAVAANAREIVEGTLTLIRSRLMQEKITVDVEIADDLPEFVCRVQQLRQVLMNLVMNARDALNHRAASRIDPKRIAIKVRKSSANGACGVVFEVADNGDGIDPALTERIFDPFFTTKSEGENVGLGLSISHGIVRAHGGNIRCASVLGESTMFRVELPCGPAGEVK